MPRRRPIAGERGRPRPGSPEQATAPVEDVGSAPRAVEPAETTAPAPPPAPPVAGDDDRPARAGRRVDVVLLLSVALVVVLALTAGALVLRTRSDDRIEQARAAARAAAERHAVTLLSYDHRHLDKDFAAAKKVLTGGFAKDYASTTEKVVRPTAEQVKAVVTAEVASSSVVRAKENRAVVLLFVDQTTTSTRLEGPRVDLNRVRLTLDRTGGQWLVSAVDAL
jgi:Mce-associated membrane protein